MVTASPAPVAVPPPGFNPEVAAKLFSPRRAWKHDAYVAMAKQSAVPLYTYRSDDPELKDVTPLAFIAMRAVVTATSPRFTRLRAALSDLASPELTTGPAHLTELGALMASCFASLGSHPAPVGVMANWQQKASQHLLHMGVNWEDAWRQTALSFHEARQRRLYVNTTWSAADTLARWERALNGKPQTAPHGLKDPTPDGCCRLMGEWWGRASHWAHFPAERLHNLAPVIADPQAFQDQVLTRLATWPDLTGPERRASAIDRSLVATFTCLEQRIGPLKEAQRAVLGALVDSPALPLLTAWVRQRAAVDTPPEPTRARRRLRA
jgi:hypothetical protein